MQVAKKKHKKGKQKKKKQNNDVGKQKQRAKKTNNKENTYYEINVLPDEIMLSIFHFLDTRSVCVSSSVCQHWYHLLSDPSLLQVST